MKIFILNRTQVLPIGLDLAWRFFSDPHNLAKITPPSLDFSVQSDVSGVMYPGMIIHYKVRPLLGVPARWTTEITHVQEPYYFVDEQRLGPYKMWHHEHHFKEVLGGVEMTDRITYAIGYGPLDGLINSLVVAPRLCAIFDYRHEVLADQFIPTLDP